MAATNSFSSIRLQQPPRRVLVNKRQLPIVAREDKAGGSAAVAASENDFMDDAEAPAGLSDGDRANLDRGVLSQQIRQEIEAEYSERWRLAARVLHEAEVLRDRVLEEADITTLRLAFEIAKKIIHREATLNSDVLIYNVREALRHLRETGSLTLLVHPDDVKLLKCDDSICQELEKRVRRLEIKASSDIERGGCLLESDAGLIDARLQSQLDEIERIVLEVTG